MLLLVLYVMDVSLVVGRFHRGDLLIGIFVLARLMTSEGEKSGQSDGSRQLYPSTSRCAGRVVQFNVCSNLDEGAGVSVLPRCSMPRVGQAVSVATDTEGHAVDRFAASKFNFYICRRRMDVVGILSCSKKIVGVS